MDETEDRSYIISFFKTGKETTKEAFNAAIARVIMRTENARPRKRSPGTKTPEKKST